MIEVEHKQTRVIVTFIGNVTEEGIIELISAIDQLRSYYFYHQIDLRIASPGGDVVALDYFIDALSHWQRQDLKLTTRALTTCKSAAAIMLSLGDRREASSSSLLHYHNSRILGQSGPITSDSAEEVMEKLKSIDERMLVRLVDRVVARNVDNYPKGELKDIDKIVLQSLRIEWSNRANEETDDDEDDESWLETWLDETRGLEDGKKLRARWSGLYDALLDQDKPISATLAIRLGLIDDLVGPTLQKSGESALDAGVRWLEIPEWRAVYPEGKVDERYLRRHTLVMGETGSGKTRSAILPALISAYRSPRVGVGLVIDPKHELDDALEGWSNREGEHKSKRLVRISGDGYAIDLMSGAQWSIKEMIEKEEYWSAAQRILQRIATITNSNPARILLGEPPTDRDSYWPQEATMLTTTVISVAIDLLVHPDRYSIEIGEEEPDGRIRMRAVAMDRLYSIGARTDLLVNEYKKYIDKAEASLNDEENSGTEAEADFNTQRYVGYVSEMVDPRIGPGELDRRGQYQRDRIISGLVKDLKDRGASPEKRRILDLVFEKWNKSQKSEDDFYATIREFRLKMLSGSGKNGIPNVFTIASMICDDLFSMVESEGHDYGSEVKYSPLHALADIMRDRIGGEYEIIAKHIKKYADMRDGVEKQYAGAYGVADTIWQEAVSKEIRNTVYFGCESPNRNRPNGSKLKFLDFIKDVARRSEDMTEDPGTLYIYQPNLGGLDNLVAKACKVLFFESVLGNRERARNGEGMPLAAYIADEFQRFITADRIHGEQSFLDVCRSFGAFTVIACQSIASLDYALCALEENADKRRSAIDIICNNTAAKLFFRTTDKDTSDRLDTICPDMPGGALVTRVRPLSTLAPGECYASLPDGRFERVQIDEFGSHASDTLSG